MLNTVALKTHHLAIVENDREVDDELPHGLAQNLMQPCIQIKVLGRYAKLLAGHAEDVVVCAHDLSRFDAGQPFHWRVDQGGENGVVHR